MNIETKRAVGAFLGISGLLGVLVQLLTAPSNMRSLAFIALFASLVIIGVWIAVPGLLRAYRAHRALPSVHELEDVCVSYQVIQATPNEIGWIAQLEAEVYSTEDAIPERILREWYSINSNGFSIIKMADGSKIGHIDILPIRPNTLDSFLKGDIKERDIRGDSLYGMSEQDLIRDLYVESIILRPPKPLSNTPAILCVLSNIVPMIQRIVHLGQVEYVYAIAASTSGEKLLRHLGFDLFRPASTRTDNHDLFRVHSSALAKRVLTICKNRIEATEMLQQLAGANGTNSL